VPEFVPTGTTGATGVVVSRVYCCGRIANFRHALPDERGLPRNIFEPLPKLEIGSFPAIRREVEHQRNASAGRDHPPA
jgi:hypothetical protein